jgi:hypothetical protein
MAVSLVARASWKGGVSCWSLLPLRGLRSIHVCIHVLVIDVSRVSRVRPTYLNLLFRTAPPSNIIPDLRWEGRFLTGY